MSWGRKRVCLALLVALAMVPLAAQDSVFIGDGDIGGIRIFDSQGVALDATEEVASNIGQGWVIYNPDSPILIVTPKGTINLFEDSILITGDLISDNPTLYLVKGKATFNTYDMGRGTLSVSTPVSLFKLTGDGEMFVITDDAEESVTVFKGSATSYNSITRATRTIETFQKLGMHEGQAKPRPIQTGYYLTYATYPDLMLAKQLLNEMATPVETPRVPAFSSVLQKPQEPQESPVAPGVTIMPIEQPAFVLAQRTEVDKPPMPYTLTVTSTPIKVPSIPRTPTSSLVPLPKDRIVVTVRPMAPNSPTLVQARVTPAMPPTPQPSALPETPVSFGAKVEADVAMEAPAVPPAPAGKLEETEAASVPAKQEKPQSILFTQEQDLKDGSVGVLASYSFLFDGTDSNRLHNTITLKPFVQYKSFLFRAQASITTEDFSTYSSNLTTMPVGKLATLAYGFNFISALRIGYSSSPFFLALDNNRYHSPLSEQYFTPRFGESTKLGMFNRIEMGSFSTHAYVDDLYLTSLLSNNPQFASFALEYENADGYRLSASIGSLVRIDRAPWDLKTYPYVNLSLPLIDIRTTQLALLFSAGGYLPLYPNFKPEEFIDPALTTLFPNYQVSAALALEQGAFSAKLMGSFRKGENRNFLDSEIAYAFDSAPSVFDLFAETGFSGKRFGANLALNLPFANDLSIATVAGHKADLSILTLSYKQSGFTISLGLQEVGITDTIRDIFDGTQDLTTLFGGSRASSFLSVSYATGGLTIRAKADYPPDPTLYTTPKISITASYRLGLQF
ncbi:MAG: hypothetical protein RBR15_15825 [Sphaerochaeta sp.]|nr:hypothetical protein [Sphaerochaeta sp.]